MEILCYNIKQTYVLKRRKVGEIHMTINQEDCIMKEQKELELMELYKNDLMKLLSEFERTDCKFLIQILTLVRLHLKHKKK